MHQSLHGADAETRKVAFGRLAATMALTAAAAGVRGAYFYSTIMLLAGAFMGLLGDDDDDDEALRKFALESASPDFSYYRRFSRGLRAS
jgi:hypothetical protein